MSSQYCFLLKLKNHSISCEALTSLMDDHRFVYAGCYTQLRFMDDEITERIDMQNSVSFEEFCGRRDSLESEWDCCGKDSSAFFQLISTIQKDSRYLLFLFDDKSFTSQVLRLNHRGSTISKLLFDFHVKLNADASGLFYDFDESSFYGLIIRSWLDSDYSSLRVGFDLKNIPGYAGEDGSHYWGGVEVFGNVSYLDDLL